MKDFTKRTTGPKFTLDGDVFTCRKSLPARIAQEFVRVFSKDMENDEKFEAAESLVLRLLTRSSRKLFEERLKVGTSEYIEKEDGNEEDELDPIGVTELLEIMAWMMEEYGLRPTRPSSSSLDGDLTNEIGASSMDVVPQTVSTP